MSSTMLIFCAICFIAVTVWDTAPPPSTASLLALAAMLSVTRALSLFCVIEADMVSIDAVVSSTEEACSLAACERLCAVALTWLAAPVRALAAPRTSSMMPASFSALEFASFFTWSKMPSESRVMRWVRSPSARPEKTRPTSSMIAPSFSLVAFASWLTWPKVPA